ncbi:MAG TPA: formyl transferase, partial [Verrucomicrobiae bacterium]|nr:formyl transferase [Verrucomicrobiae bacterium]
PIGPWRPHPRNPVLSDVRSARPAGRLIRRDGRWYRPAQDGSVSYGWALSLNRIDRLDDEGFRETRVAQLQPNWRKEVVGTHTLSEADDLTAIDLSVRWPKVGRGRFRTD